METEVTTTPTVAPEQTDAQKTWQEYLQKCCEFGQLQHALEQLDSQKRDIEKNVEVTMRAMKSLAHKHKENQQKNLILKPEPPTTTETVEAH